MLKHAAATAALICNMPLLTSEMPNCLPRPASTCSYGSFSRLARTVPGTRPWIEFHSPSEGRGADEWQVKKDPLGLVSYSGFCPILNRQGYAVFGRLVRIQGESEGEKSGIPSLHGIKLKIRSSQQIEKSRGFLQPARAPQSPTICTLRC
ncbi:hypothetical protein BZA77DRAFT_309785 [Pyronema omphalodes]|nr:hypothetical protein BZA77DRAFT_309785 [Pyronema omphalodes]